MNLLFTIDLAGNPNYVFAFADSASTLDSPPTTNDSHYYGSCTDPSGERALAIRHINRWLLLGQSYIWRV